MNFGIQLLYLNFRKDFFMKVTKQLLNLNTSPVFHELPDLHSSFFFDIETTGLSPKNSYIYLIGVFFLKDNSWHCHQWLAQKKSEESSILDCFFSFCTPYQTMIHFNGRRFDLPFILERCRQLHLLCPLSGLSEFDLYQNIRPLKQLLKLEKLTQNYLEQYLDIHRFDAYSGKQLISVYDAYQKEPSPQLEEALFLHNREDLTGMAAIVPLLSYHALKEGNFSLKNVLPIEDPVHGFALKVSVTLPYILPLPVSFQNSYGAFSAREQECHFLIYGICTALKHYFPDYKNYDYPMEERVIHKSLSSYVDRRHRRPAKPEECYVSKTGRFLPQKKCFFEPSFQDQYHAPVFFFEYREEILSDTRRFLSYIQNLFLQ